MEITPIKIKLDEKQNNIQLYALSDIHIGSRECDVDLVKEVIEHIRTTPNMYVILLGDILDTALKNSKSDIYSSAMSIAESQQLALEILAPIKDKIIGMTPGNHENRVWREVGIDMSLWLAQKLGVEDKYRTDALALTIDFGRDRNGRAYKLNIFGQHGAGGTGRKLGAAMNGLEDLDGIVANADIYVRGHSHASISGRRKAFIFTQQGNLNSQTKFYYNAPSFLKTGGYGLSGGYKPQDISPKYINIRAYDERIGSRLERKFKIDEIML